MIRVTGLYVYPVKSLGGISVSHAEFGARGLMYDREWLIIDTKNQFITQRDYPSMSLIKTEIDRDAGSLLLHLPTKSGDEAGESTSETLAVPLKPIETDETIKVLIWSDSARATVESDEINNVLSNYLGEEVRLVRMADRYKRRVDGRYAPGKDNIVGFADAFPLLIIGDESLEDLNSKLEYPLLMNRFRPNITTSGGGAFGEDKWKTIKVSGIDIKIVKPCDRCQVTTIDQESGVRGKEPLRTLANYRQKNGKILFGQNAVFKGKGKIEVGAEVSLVD